MNDTQPRSKPANFLEINAGHHPEKTVIIGLERSFTYGELRIIGLKAYKKGYTGFLENEEAYVFFNTIGRQYHPVQSYPKKDFEGFHHFFTLMSKFVNSSFFLKTPVDIAAVDMETLDRIHLNRGGDHRH
jgi:hypothetical protein